MIDFLEVSISNEYGIDLHLVRLVGNVLVPQIKQLPKCSQGTGYCSANLAGKSFQHGQLPLARNFHLSSFLPFKQLFRWLHPFSLSFRVQPLGFFPLLRTHRGQGKLSPCLISKEVCKWDSQIEWLAGRDLHSHWLSFSTTLRVRRFNPTPNLDYKLCSEAFVSCYLNAARHRRNCLPLEARSLIESSGILGVTWRAERWFTEAPLSPQVTWCPMESADCQGIFNHLQLASLTNQNSKMHVFKMFQAFSTCWLKVLRERPKLSGWHSRRDWSLQTHGTLMPRQGENPRS